MKITYQRHSTCEEAAYVPGALLVVSECAPGVAAERTIYEVRMYRFRGAGEEFDPVVDIVASVAILSDESGRDAREQAQRVLEWIYRGWAASSKGRAFIEEWCRHAGDER